MNFKMYAVAVRKSIHCVTAPDWAAAGLEADRDRAYGDTTMWWGRPTG